MYPAHVELAAASAEPRQCETVPISEILRATRKLRSHTTGKHFYHIPSRISLAESKENLSETSASSEDDVFRGESTIKFHKGRQTALDSEKILQSVKDQTKISITGNPRRKKLPVVKLGKNSATSVEKEKEKLQFYTCRDPVVTSGTDSSIENLEGPDYILHTTTSRVKTRTRTVSDSDDGSFESDFLAVKNTLGQENPVFQEQLQELQKLTDFKLAGLHGENRLISTKHMNADAVAGQPVAQGAQPVAPQLAVPVQAAALDQQAPVLAAPAPAINPGAQAPQLQPPVGQPPVVPQAPQSALVNSVAAAPAAQTQQMFFPPISMMSEERVLCPAPFTGSADDDPVEFWRRFKNYLEFKQVTNDADKLRLAKAMCVGEAGDWSDNLDNASRSNFQAFSHAFEQR